MTFTYDDDGASFTTRDELRRKIGDTISARPLYTDEELDNVLSSNGGEVLTAAAACCRELAAAATRGAISGSLPGLSISKANLPDTYLRMAAAFELEAASPLKSTPTEISVMDSASEQLAVSIDDRFQVESEDFTPNA